MMPCACACFMVAERTLKFFWGDDSCATALLCSWAGQGRPLRPYLDFGATGAPTFNLGVYWDTWGLSPSPSPCPRPLQSLGLHYDRLHLLCRVWPRIQPWGPYIAFFAASILDYLTVEYPDDYGLEISGLAAQTIAFQYFAGAVEAESSSSPSLVWAAFSAGHCG